MTPFFRQPVLGVLLLGIAASSAAAQSLLSQYGEVVQGPGEQVTGMAAGVVWDTGSLASGLPGMDLNGNMIWRGKIAGTGITTGTNDQGIFYGRTRDDLQLILQRGAAEPSGTLAGVTVNYSATAWDVPRLSAENNFLLFGTTLAGTGVTTANDSAIYMGIAGGGLQILAREGDTAPTGGATFTGNISGAWNSTGLTSLGVATIKVKLLGGDVGAPNGPSSTWGDDALLTGVPGPGGLTWCVREGDLINGGAQAVGTLDTFNFTMDESGRVMFVQPLSTTLGSSPATSANDATIMLYTPGSGLSLVAREGDPAPGAGGCSYGTFSSSAFSRQALSRNGGKIQFVNNMTGGDVVGASNDLGMFAGTIGGTIARVARETDAAPTGVPGEFYSAFFTSGQAAINNNGTVVFVAQLGSTGPLSTFEDVAVFRAVPPYGPGDVTMIAREGDPVSGLAPGTVIGNTGGGGMSSSATRLAINERESVLISVAGIGVPAVTWGDAAVLTWDPEHAGITGRGLRCVTVIGDSFTVNGGPWAQSNANAGWTTTVGSGSGDGCDVGFNNNGDVCFKLFNSSQNAIVRGHVGSMISEPSSVPVAGGVPHNFHIDCGPSQAGQLYLVLATGSGTRPGFVSPFGGQKVPLNPLDLSLSTDLWFDLSLNNSNSIVWPGTLGFLDANGKNITPASFVMPPGFPVFLGTTLHHAVVAFDLSVPPLQTTYASEPSAVKLY